MMLPSLAFMLLAPPTPATARMVGASLFKNGFAVVQRIVEVPKPGSTVVVPIPQGALGTLWFTASDGLTLDSVAVENETVSSVTAPAASLDVLLALNVGKSLTLVLGDTTPATRLLCRLVSASGTLVVVQTPQGTTRAFNKSAVVGIEGKGLKSDSTFATAPRRVMRLRTLGRPGRVSIVSLERGLSWSPAYAVNLQPDGKTLVLVSKATIANDLERLSSLDCRLVTGFPNLPFMETLDPLVQYLAMLPMASGGFGGGGMGGGGFGGQQAAAFENRRGQVGYNDERTLAAAAQAPDGEYRGELFFYRRPNVSVDVGGRAAYTLFTVRTGYDTLYTWDLVDPAPGQSRLELRILPPGTPSPDEVWQTLRFKNAANVPLTTGPATTFSGGEIVGQDTLRYASPGQNAEMRVTRSLDLAPDSLEEEAGRERAFIKYDNGGSQFDRVTVRGTLTLVNRKATAATVRIRKSFTGEWISGEGEPAVSRTAAGLRQPNPTGLAEWTKTIAPGETLRLTYTTRLLVNS